MTSKLELKYSKSLSTMHNQLTIRAKIIAIRGGWVTIGATIENANGDICVEGQAIYYAFDKEKAKEMGFEHCDVEDEQLLPM
jgi:acyl-CoA thioesterase FadM